MFATIGAFILKLFAGPILDALKQRDASGRDITIAGIGSEKEQVVAQLQAATAANQLRAASAPQFRLLIYLIALPPALHFAAVCLDTTPFWTPWGAHVVGAWSVEKLPPPYGDYQRDILMSFFIVAPVAQGIRTIGSIAAAAVARR
jgi:hypothetical protein